MQSFSLPNVKHGLPSALKSWELGIASSRMASLVLLKIDLKRVPHKIPRGKVSMLIVLLVLLPAPKVAHKLSAAHAAAL